MASVRLSKIGYYLLNNIPHLRLSELDRSVKKKGLSDSGSGDYGVSSKMTPLPVPPRTVPP